MGAAAVAAITTPPPAVAVAGLCLMMVDEGSEGEDFAPTVAGRKLGLVAGRVLPVGAHPLGVHPLGVLPVGDFCRGLSVDGSGCRVTGRPAAAAAAETVVGVVVVAAAAAVAVVGVGLVAAAVAVVGVGLLAIATGQGLGVREVATEEPTAAGDEDNDKGIRNKIHENMRSGND